MLGLLHKRKNENALFHADITGSKSPDTHRRHIQVEYIYREVMVYISSEALSSFSLASFSSYALRDRVTGRPGVVAPVACPLVLFSELIFPFLRAATSGT